MGDTIHSDGEMPATPTYLNRMHLKVAPCHHTIWVVVVVVVGMRRRIGRSRSFGRRHGMGWRWLWLLSVVEEPRARHGVGTGGSGGGRGGGSRTKVQEGHGGGRRLGTEHVLGGLGRLDAVGVVVFVAWNRGSHGEYKHTKDTAADEYNGW